MLSHPAIPRAIDDPDESDLAGVPRTFKHSRCGGQTHLSAVTVRRYLRDPFRLMGGGSAVWCAGCQKNSRAADCTWVETNENVQTYFQRLIGAAYLKNPKGWWGQFVLAYSVIGLIGVGAVTLAFWQSTENAASTLIVAAAGAAFVAVFMAVAFVIKTFRFRRFAAECRQKNP